MKNVVIKRDHFSLPGCHFSLFQLEREVFSLNSESNLTLGIWTPDKSAVITMTDNLVIHRVMSPKDMDRMAFSVDADTITPSSSTQFAQTNLGSLR